MHAIYFDTPDVRLCRHGAWLRLRKEGQHWVQTATAATTDSIRRLENNVLVMVPHGPRERTVDLRRHDGEPVGAAPHRALG